MEMAGSFPQIIMRYEKYRQIYSNCFSKIKIRDDNRSTGCGDKIKTTRSCWVSKINPSNRQPASNEPYSDRFKLSVPYLREPFS